MSLLTPILKLCIIESFENNVSRLKLLSRVVNQDLVITCCSQCSGIILIIALALWIYVWIYHLSVGTLFLTRAGNLLSCDATPRDAPELFCFVGVFINSDFDERQ